MAIINGEWLDREARAARIKLVEARIKRLEKLRKKGALLPSQLSDLVSDKKALVRLKRIERAEHDVLYFGMEYFSEDKNADNIDNLIPAGVNVANAANFHRELTAMLDDVSRGKVKRHIAWACPREHAKTAWLSNIYLVHQVVFRLRRYIVLFSETTDVAGDFITWGRYQLKLNDKLRADFGELLHVQPSRNELDNKTEFITTSGIKVEGKGLGTQTRGLRHGSTRPDLFILDDMESDESTNTAEQIEKSKTWFRDSMMPAISKGGTIVYLGTILCYGSLLHYVIDERRDFQSRKFAAVESFARNSDLWAKWRRIYREDVKEAPDNAREFFEANKEEMLEGASILWPGYWTYYELMIRLEENGTKSFNQEYMNNPTDEERQIFKPEIFTWFKDEDLANMKRVNFGSVDIAMGKEKGDFSVIASGAINNDTGTLYVYDAFMKRCHPDELIDEVVEHTFENEYEGLGVEAQAMQEFIADKMTDRLQAQGYPAHTRLHKIKQHRGTNKQLRIEALMPDIQSGKIRFHEKFKNTAEMDQFEMYPMHAHDDFPDAITLLTKVATQTQSSVRTIKQMNRW